jgi:DNA polymerase-3 subunit alpha
MTYPALVEALEWNEAEKLAKEKAVLGFYVSGHPLLRFEADIKTFATAQLGNPSAVKNGATVRIGGIITSVKKKIDKKGNMMAFATVEDFTGKGECIIFSDAYKQFHQFLMPDTMVMLSGKAEQHGDALRILVAEVTAIEQARERFARSVVLAIRVDALSEMAVAELRSVADRHKGKSACYFNVLGAGTEGAIRMQSTNHGVRVSDEFIAEVERILGPNSVAVSN